MIRIGTVIDSQNGALTLLFERPEACEKCGQCDGRQHQATLRVRGQAEVGDRVQVDLPDGRVAQAALLAYILPLALLMAGLFAAGPLHAALSLPLSQDLFTVLCALLGLVAGGLLMRRITAKSRVQRHFQPQVLGVLPKDIL